MFKQYEHFTPDEFKCPCCGRVHMGEGFMDRLESARRVAGVPFRINSGWRCESHNKAVGGSATSSHLLGLAADIACADSRTRWQIVTALIGMGFKRIGVADSFIHVDSDPAKAAEVIWTY